MYCKHCGVLVDRDAKFCTNCGGKLEARPTRIVYQEELTMQKQKEASTNRPGIWLLVSGILTLCAAVIVLTLALRSVGTSNDYSGVGLLVTILLVVSGLLSILAKGHRGEGPVIAAIVLFAVAAIFCLMYTSLIPWGLWCIACIVVDCVMRSRK